MIKHQSINRACEQCKRKKIRCDGARPKCALCTRSSQECFYPRRKPRKEKRQHVIATNVTSQDTISKGQAPAPRFSPWQLPRSSSSSVSGSPDNVQPDLQSLCGVSPTTLGLRNTLPADWSNLNTDLNVGGERNEHSTHVSLEVFPGIWENNDADLLALLSSSADNRGTLAGIMDASPARDTLCPPDSGDFHPAPSSIGGDELLSSMLQGEDNQFSLSTPAFVVDELLYLFFLRVHPFLPLLHRPRFHQTYVALPQYEKYVNLSKQSFVLLHAMMALAARYSASSYFVNTHEKDRGAIFAQTLGGPDGLIEFFETEIPSVTLLQSCILVAYYNRSSCAPNDASKLVALCLRLAENLGVHTIDEAPSEHADIGADTSVGPEWVSTEEKRRAWWSMWELDAFETILTRRASGIDLRRVHIRLPVPDEAWFAEKPMASPLVHFNLSLCWKTLKASCHDARAWFLVSNLILVRAFAMTRHVVVQSEAVDELDMVVTCFSLLFSEKLRLPFHNLRFDKQNYVQSNWLILTQLMVQSTRMIVSLLQMRIMFNLGAARSEVFENGMVKRSWEEHILTDASVQSFQQPVDEVLRLCRSWLSEGINFAPPTFVFLVLGPEMMNFQITRLRRLNSEKRENRAQYSLEEELLVLVVTHFARFWDIGVVILDILNGV